MLSIRYRGLAVVVVPLLYMVKNIDGTRELCKRAYCGTH